MQVASFSSKGLSVACVSGDTTDSSVKDGVCKGAYQLVYFTPEMLIMSKKWRRVVESDVYRERLKGMRLIVSKNGMCNLFNDPFSTEYVDANVVACTY